METFSGKYHSRKFRVPIPVAILLWILTGYFTLTPLAGMFSLVKIVLY